MTSSTKHVREYNDCRVLRANKICRACYIFVVLCLTKAIRNIPPIFALWMYTLISYCNILKWTPMAKKKKKKRSARRKYHDHH
jgi:hypothetical protein